MREENGDLSVKAYKINKRGERSRKFFDRDFKAGRPKRCTSMDWGEKINL